MVLYTGDVTYKDPPRPPSRADPEVTTDPATDTSSPEVTTSSSPGPEETDPAYPPIETASIDPGIPVAPVDTSGLGVIAQIAQTGGASFDNPLPDNWAAPTSNIVDSLAQYLPTAEKIEQFRQTDIDLTKKKIAAEAYADRIQEERDRDFYRSMRSRLEQESASIQDIKPWNPVTMAPPKHDLWEQFGSPGFLIAMMASSFTAMPMVSALNSGAAAMNAINQGDLEGYNRAFDEWKANTDLAIKRHSLEHAEFEDIGQLWDKDIAQGKARMQSYLTQIGDKRKLALLDAGMDDEMWKSIDGVHSAFDHVIKTVGPMLEAKALVDAVQKDPRYTSGTDIIGAVTDAERKIVEAKNPWRTGMAKPGSMEAEVARQLGIYDADPANAEKPADQQRVERAAIASDVAKGWKPQATETAAAATSKAETAAKQAETAAKKEAASTPEQVKMAKDRIWTGLHKEHPDWNERKLTDETEKEYAAVTNKHPGITANKAAELEIAADRYTTGIETIDKIVARMKKLVGSVGLAGHVFRAEESLGNILHFSNQTDRKEIERLINELQMLAPRLITESTARPMASEHEHVSKVVGGLGPGDTTPNVLANMTDLRSQLVRMRGKMEDIIQSKPFEPHTDKTETAPSSKGWDFYPTVQ